HLLRPYLRVFGRITITEVGAKELHAATLLLVVLTSGVGVPEVRARHGNISHHRYMPATMLRQQALMIRATSAGSIHSHSRHACYRTCKAGMTSGMPGWQLSRNGHCRV
ncbi:MAG: hypothetical protein ABI858_03675, partial [Pseudoxanthomonas sp.]